MDCPVCQCIFVNPKIYHCGHSVCEVCMFRIDLAATEESQLNTLPLFRCPVCRSACHESTKSRSYNHSLNEIILIQNKNCTEYQNRISEVEQEKMEIMQDVDEECIDVDLMLRIGVKRNCENNNRLNLADISKAIRERRAQSLFTTILKSVKEAAGRGAMRLIVTTRARELSEMAKEISQLLFSYGIHSVNAHPREFSINILNEEIATRYNAYTNGGEYINENYVEPISSMLSTNNQLLDEDDDF